MHGMIPAEGSFFDLGTIERETDRREDMEQSNWIWTQDFDREDECTPRIVLFRKTFILGKLPAAASVRVSADTRYKLYVNGQFAQFGPSKGDRQIWFADTVDLAPYLREGENVLGAAVLRFPEDREAGCHSMFRTRTPGLYVKGGAGEADLSADASWACRTVRSITFVREEKEFSPLIIHENASGDARLAGWKLPGYDDAAWEKAVPYLKSEMPESIAPGNLQDRTIPYLYRKKRRFAGILGPADLSVKTGKPAGDSSENQMEREAAVTALLAKDAPLMIPAGRKVRVVLDAGEEMTGFLQIAMTGGKGARITLLESEAYVLDEKSPTSGTSIKKDRRDYESGHLEGYEDQYLAAGYGRGDVSLPASSRLLEVYESFWFRTFRFIELTVETDREDLTLRELTFEETGYPLQVLTQVRTSDDSFEKIWEISERTLRRCMHETYEDCPFYEQLQYVMDTRSQILYTYSVSADDRLARKAIDDFARGQRYDGLLNCSYPNMNPNIIPGFSIYYILMVHDHMMYFGDRRLVKRYLPVIDQILNFFDRNLTENGLVGKVGGVNLQKKYWSFIDWTPEWNPTTGMPPAGLYGPITMESLLYVYGLQKEAELCSYVGRNDTASEYLSRAEAVKDAMRRRCTDEDGMITDGPVQALDRALQDQPEGAGHAAQSAASQHCQVFGVLTGLLDKEQGRRNLLRTMEEPGHAQCTVAMCFYLFRALEETDLYAYSDHYWDIWRNMVEYGCTTTVESEDYARSECHAWGALALYELPSAILGVRPAAPGYEKVDIHPHTEFLDFAEGTVQTPKGTISVSWKKQDGQVKVRTKTPPAAH